MTGTCPRRPWARLTWRHTTVAAALLKPSEHTVPNWPLCLTSTLPAVVLAGLWLTRRTEAAGRAAARGRTLSAQRQHMQDMAPLAAPLGWHPQPSLFAGSGMSGSPTGTSSVGATMYCNGCTGGRA